VPGETFAIRGDARRTGRGELALALALSVNDDPPPPLDLTLVVDRTASGGRDGRLAAIARDLGTAASQLRPGDRVDLVVFDTTACTALGGYVVGRDDPTLLQRAIAAIPGSHLGGAAAEGLVRGLDEGLRLARERAAARPDGHPRNARVLVATTLALPGPTEPVMGEVVRAYQDREVRVTWVTDSLPTDTRSARMLVSTAHGALLPARDHEVVDRLFRAGLPGLTHTVAEDLEVTLTLPPSLRTAQVQGRGAEDPPRGPSRLDLLAGQGWLFLQALRFRGQDPDPDAVIVVDLAWTDPDTGYPDTWSWRARVGDLLGQPPGTANVDKALLAGDLADMLVAEAVSDGFCKARRKAFDERAATIEDPEVDALEALLGDRCRTWPHDRYDYVDETHLEIPVAMMELCVAPSVHAMSATTFRLAPPTIASPWLGCTVGAAGGWGRPRSVAP
jgi:hypothetical protein